MDNKYKKLISWGIPIAIAAVAIVLVYSMRINNPPFDMDYMPPIQALSDAFIVTGMMYVGFGALMWISTTGVLDIIGYGFKSVLYLFTPMQKEKDEGGFYEYKLQKQAKRKSVPFEYFWIGIALVITSMILAAFV